MEAVPMPGARQEAPYRSPRVRSSILLPRASDAAGLDRGGISVSL